MIDPSTTDDEIRAIRYGLRVGIAISGLCLFAFMIANLVAMSACSLIGTLLMTALLTTLLLRHYGTLEVEPDSCDEIKRWMSGSIQVRNYINNIKHTPGRSMVVTRDEKRRLRDMYDKESVEAAKARWMNSKPGNY